MAKKKKEEAEQPKQLWQLAKPFGRPAKFPTAESLWNAFLAYIQWAADNPMVVTIKGTYVDRPLSLVAFRLHAGIKRDWDTFKDSYAQKGEDFSGVLHAIESTVRQQQVENAIVGNYKENIVSRIHNLSDTINQVVSGNIKQEQQLSPKEAAAFIKELNKKI